LPNPDSSQLRRRIERLAAKRDVLQARRDELEGVLVTSKLDQIRYGEAQQLIIKIGQLYRKRSVESVQENVTKALQLVFERPYEFILRQEVRRGQIEDEMLVKVGSAEMDPVTEMGGGITDVISIVLRPILWSKMKSRTSPVMVLDEPARLVNSDLSVRNLSQLLWQLAKGLSLQFIVVTNKPGLAHSVDRLFEVVKRNEVSEVNGTAG
jgi:chromosome segregation ATPase